MRTLLLFLPAFVLIFMIPFLPDPTAQEQITVTVTGDHIPYHLKRP